MHMTRLLPFLTLLGVLALGSSTANALSPSRSDEWKPLLDEGLSQWGVFLGVPHGSLGLAGVPPDSDGMRGKPLGAGDALGVFSVYKEGGEPVLHISGKTYGGLTTQAVFSNYHLRVQFKWGEKKWAPRETKKRDNGILYHAHGADGAFWNVWRASVEFQIQETDMGDIYALAGTSVEVPISLSGKTWRFDPAGKVERIRTGDGVPLFMAGHRVGYFERPNGEWNDLQLLVLGNQAVHVVNGQVVLIASNLSTRVGGSGEKPLTEGHLTLQSEGAEAYFRRIEIRQITEIPAEFR